MGVKLDKTGTISGGCFAPGEVLATSKEAGQASGISLFGFAAEKSIERDYSVETNPAPYGFEVLRNTDSDWFDTGQRQDYIYILLKNHPHLRKKDVEDAISNLSEQEQFQMPDILTFNGVSLVALNNAVLARGRNEFYEIKPDSPTGLTAGEEKLKNIPKLYRRLGLPYKPGDYYPVQNPKEIQLIKNRLFIQMVRIIMRRLGIPRIRVYLQVRRPERGLLLYSVCIEIETQDKRKQQALAKAVAKHLYAAHVVCHAPDKFREAALQQVAREIGDYSLGGDKFPVVRCSFDALDTLNPYKKSIEEAINMRGLGLPGEEYLICCDDNFYKAVLAPRTPDIIGQVWAKLLENPTTRALYAAGSTAWQKLRPVVLEGSATAKMLSDMYPELREFANLIAAWAADHPYLSITIIVTAFVLTASVVGLLEAGLIGAGAAILASETITETTVVPVASTLGRFAMTEGVGSQVFTSEVAAGAASRGLLTSAQVAAQLSARGAAIGVAANDVAWLGSALSQSGVASAAAKTAAVGLAASFVLMVNANTAYAQTAGSSAKPEDKVVAQAASRLFMARAVGVPRGGLKPPSNGSSINLLDYAEMNTLIMPDTPPVYARLVGRVRLS